MTNDLRFKFAIDAFRADSKSIGQTGEELHLRISLTVLPSKIKLLNIGMLQSSPIIK